MISTSHKTKQSMINENEFKPQPSTRIASRIAPDNDRWTEYLAVVDLLNPRTNAYQLEIRSFFESSATGMKAWDEPPSGAIHIEWASDESKKMAHMQLKDLRVIGSDKAKARSTKKKMGKKKEKQDLTSKETQSSSWMKKLSFRRKPLMGTPDEQDGPVKISYEEGSDTAAFMIEANHPSSSCEEQNVQMALRNSLTTRSLSASASTPNPAYASKNEREISPSFASMSLQEENDIAMATVLSLSETANINMFPIPINTGSAVTVAVGEDDYVNEKVPADDYLDRKMPANPYFTSQRDKIEKDNLDKKMPADTSLAVVDEHKRDYFSC